MLPSTNSLHPHPQVAETTGLYVQMGLFSGRSKRSCLQLQDPTRVLGMLRRKSMQSRWDCRHTRRGGVFVHDHLALASTRGTDHGICTNNVRMQTKRLLLGMVGRKRPVSAQLTDEVVHEHTALASLRGVIWGWSVQTPRFVRCGQESCTSAGKSVIVQACALFPIAMRYRIFTENKKRYCAEGDYRV